MCATGLTTDAVPVPIRSLIGATLGPGRVALSNPAALNGRVEVFTLTSTSPGFCPSSFPLFRGVTRPLVADVVSMSRSFVEEEEPHVVPERRALVDPVLTLPGTGCGRSRTK